VHFKLFIPTFLCNYFPLHLQVVHNDVLSSAGAASSRGAGYGLGITIEDILPFSGCDAALDMQLSPGAGDDLGSSCPSSLLRDWLDLRCLNPEDMDALQKELELGSPMSVDGDHENMMK